MDRLLVVGGGGFIGSAVMRAAAAAGVDARGTSRVRRGPGLIGCDFEEHEVVGLLRTVRPTVIVHAAGLASVAGSFEDPDADRAASFGLWSTLLAALERSGVRPAVVLVGSAAVYGDPAVLPVPETSPRRPLSPYGEHRVLCEDLADDAAARLELPVVVARVFSTIGEGQRRLLAYELARQVLGPEPVVGVRGTGLESRDYLHVDDVAAALLLLGGLPATGTARRVNVASGVEVTVSELAQRIVRASRRVKDITYAGITAAGDPDRWVADISRLRSLCPGWSPRRLDLALEQCLEAWAD